MTHGFCCDDSEVAETKVVINSVKSEDQNVVDSTTRSEANTGEDIIYHNDQPNEDISQPREVKPYEVFEEITEYIPLPYHLQKQRNKENISTDDLLQTAESRYEVPVKTTHSYQVTENTEEEEEYENKIDHQVPIHKRTYPQHFKNAHLINNNDHSYFNYDQNNEKTQFTITPKQQLFTTADFKKEDEHEKQPLSVIVLRPISNSNQVQKPIRVKVLKPLVVSNQNSYEEVNDSGNIIINNGEYTPILALRVLKSYIANDNRFDYQQQYHSTVEKKSILIKVLKSNYKNSNNYRNFHKSLLTEEYAKKLNNEQHKKDLGNNNYYNRNANRSKPERYESEEGDDYDNKYAIKQTTEQSDSENKNADQQKRYFIYLVNKQKPYVNIRRVNNKHR